MRFQMDTGNDRQLPYLNGAECLGCTITVDTDDSLSEKQKKLQGIRIDLINF